ncbi:MAG: 23S rRNA (adenine(2503)-C(2))-methyltransferase RlmN [Planctomycetes bacterium]|nr:23S rRNA (adenine(2503)-C(2))-methyltransferase RlmN [Planctomycetota bacterium]
MESESISSSSVNFFDLTPGVLTDWLTANNHPAYRAGQILQWVYDRGVASVDEMTNLPRALRQQLADHFQLYEATVARHLKAPDGVQKLLLQWPDGTTTECVAIPDRRRSTVCLSTQVGCPVGCVFCASGLDGLQRQLTAGQIIEQAMRVRAIIGRSNEATLSNVVFMGLGEPLHNYDATVGAIRTINAEWGMNIGARKITVSTVGLPKQIKRLAREKLQITLAVSLHAPNDALRRQIIPWAESISLDSLIDAANDYFTQTGREITIEYVLLAGLNDHPRQARELATVAKRMRSHVNLIRYNPVEGLPYRRPTAEAVYAFQRVLRERGVNNHLRKSRGLDIDAACGQLRRRQAGSPS